MLLIFGVLTYFNYKSYLFMNISSLYKLFTLKCNCFGGTNFIIWNSLFSRDATTEFTDRIFVVDINMLSLRNWHCLLEILLIMPALCSMPIRYCAGIISSSLIRYVNESNRFIHIQLPTFSI